MENLAASPYYPSSEGEIVRPRPPPTDALDGSEPPPPAAAASATAQKPVEVPTATAAEVEEPSTEEEEEPATNSGKAKRNLASAFADAASGSSMEKNEDDQVQQQTPVIAIDMVDITTVKKTVKKKLSQVTYIYKFYPKRDNKSRQDAGELSKYESFIFTHTPKSAEEAEAEEEESTTITLPPLLLLLGLPAAAPGD